MKNALLFSLVVTLTGNLAYGQAIYDTVSIGAGYTNQVWYSLENDEQKTEPKNNWNIAFDASAFGSSILLNSADGNELWRYPGDSADFATLDTTGINNWIKFYNADTSWAYGAFSRDQAGTDVGWGEYSTITHQITGDSLYVIKLASGAYQKLWIQRLASGTYTFRHTTLDNSMDMVHQLSKSTYDGKNFGYYNLQMHQAVDREPLSDEWDLTFTQYTAFIPIPYTVSGVLHNAGVTTAKAYPVDDPGTFSNFSPYTFNNNINTIGYDWKSFQGGWSIQDSLVYFVKSKAGDTWKLVFTEFGGSGTGEFMFYKEKLVAAGIDEAQAKATLELYPNPANDLVNIILPNQLDASATLHLLDITGKKVKSVTPQLNSIMHTMNVSDMPSGLYFVVLQTATSTTVQKLTIQ
jgi:hypothetical protein